MPQTAAPPLTYVYAVTAIACVFTAVYALLGEPAPMLLAFFTPAAPVIAIGAWLRGCLARARQSVPYDFGLFVYFGWPVVFLMYLLRLHGRRGWWQFAKLFALVAAPTFVDALIRSIASGVP